MIKNEIDITFGNNTTKDSTTVQKCLHNSGDNLKAYKQSRIRNKDIYLKRLISMCQLTRSIRRLIQQNKVIFERGKDIGFYLSWLSLNLALPLVDICLNSNTGNE